MKINEFKVDQGGPGGKKRGPGSADKNGFKLALEQCRNTERQASIKGIKDLARDAFTLDAEQIKQEIDLACGCETGENIDMERLNELLKLYRSLDK